MQALTNQPVLEVIMAASDLTAARLRELLHYDPDTGVFTARSDAIGRGARRRKGDVVGGAHNKGYFHIRVDQGRFLAHRLAWLYMTGEWPAATVDHRNRDKSDNRWSNLRDVSHTVNMQNLVAAKGARKEGALGVSWRPGKNRWYAQISAAGKYHFLGSFKEKAAAEHAYRVAKAARHTPAT